MSCYLPRLASAGGVGGPEGVGFLCDELACDVLVAFVEAITFGDGGQTTRVRCPPFDGSNSSHDSCSERRDMLGHRFGKR